MIPALRYDWPAGGASFWLLGDDDTLWPSRLTNLSIGGAHCESPNLQALTTQAFNYPGCIWAGSSPIAEVFKQIHLREVERLHFDDGLFQREYISRPQSPEQWVAASHMVVGLASKGLGGAWYHSMAETSISRKYQTLRYRARNETMGFVQSWVQQCEHNVV